MKNVTLVICLIGTLFLTACSGSNNSPAPVAANCSTNGVYNPNGAQYPYGSQYPYGQPGTTGCAGLPYGTNGQYPGQIPGYPGQIPGQYPGQIPGYGQQYGYGQQGGYGSNPCAVYNTGYQYWTPMMYGGQYVCVSN